jgi:hypothetical protein
VRTKEGPYRKKYKLERRGSEEQGIRRKSQGRIRKAKD